MINLVPPQIKKEQKMQKAAGKALYFVFTFLIILLVFTAAIFVADNFLRIETGKLDTKIEEASANETKYKSLETNITGTNKKIDSLSKTDSTKVLWSNIITELSDITPKNLQIKTLSLDADTGKISLTGVAASRTEIALLKDNMESSPKFKNVTFSSSNLEETTKDFTFNMSCELEASR